MSVEITYLTNNRTSRTNLTIGERPPSVDVTSVKTLLCSKDYKSHYIADQRGVKIYAGSNCTGKDVVTSLPDDNIRNQMLDDYIVIKHIYKQRKFGAERKREWNFMLNNAVKLYKEILHYSE
jgi:hypothetical protein